MLVRCSSSLHVTKSRPVSERRSRHAAPGLDLTTCPGTRRGPDPVTRHPGSGLDHASGTRRGPRSAPRRAEASTARRAHHRARFARWSIIRSGSRTWSDANFGGARLDALADEQVRKGHNVVGCSSRRAADQVAPSRVRTHLVTRHPGWDPDDVSGLRPGSLPGHAPPGIGI